MAKHQVQGTQTTRGLNGMGCHVPSKQACNGLGRTSLLNEEMNAMGRGTIALMTNGYMTRGPSEGFSVIRVLSSKG